MNISFTKIQTFLACPKKYYWSHVAKLEPRNTPDYYNFGKLFHKGLEGEDNGSIASYVGLKANVVFPKLPCERREVPVAATVGLHTLLAVADLVTDTDVVEYKTTSRGCAETVKAHQLSLQQRLYCKLFGKPNSRLRLVKKTAIRQRQKESEDEFLQRQKDEYANVNDHFLEIVTPNVDVSGVMDEVGFAIEVISKAHESGIWLRSAPYACYSMVACPFLDLCNNYDENRHMYKEKDNDETLSK